jgi:hypothetical protein
MGEKLAHRQSGPPCEALREAQRAFHQRGVLQGLSGVDHCFVAVKIFFYLLA